MHPFLTNFHCCLFIYDNGSQTVVHVLVLHGFVHLVLRVISILGVGFFHEILNNLISATAMHVSSGFSGLDFFFLHAI